MQLLWIYYKGKNPRYILCLELYRTADKLIILESEKVEPQAKNRIVSSYAILKKIAPQKRVTWIKKYCPLALKACKTLDINKIQSLTTYQIN